MENKIKIKKKKTSIGQIMFFIIFLVIGFISGFCGSMYIFSDDNKPLHIKLFFLAGVIICLIFAIYSSTIIHELGHLVFGLLTGYEFLSFRIGNLMWVKKNKEIRLKRYSLMGSAGQCLLVPPKMEDETLPYILYNMGGVIFNLITSILFLALYFVFDGIWYISYICILISIINIIFAMVNGFPMCVEAIYNDGHNTLSLYKDKNALKCLWVQLMINAKLTSGLRLKDMPDTWFEIPSKEESKNPICASIGVFAFNRAIDQMNFELAKQLANEILDKNTGIADIHRNIVISELIYCELIGQNRKSIIDEYRSVDFGKFEKAMKNYPSIIRMEYTYELLANQDKLKADKKLVQFEKIAKTYPNESEIEGEWELINLAKKSYEIYC